LSERDAKRLRQARLDLDVSRRNYHRRAKCAGLCTRSQCGRVWWRVCGGVGFLLRCVCSWFVGGFLLLFWLGVVLFLLFLLLIVCFVVLVLFHRHGAAAGDEHVFFAHR
jgi:hypothetical protein